MWMKSAQTFSSQCFYFANYVCCSLCKGLPAQVWSSAVFSGYPVHYVPDLVRYD